MWRPLCTTNHHNMSPSATESENLVLIFFVYDYFESAAMLLLTGIVQ